MSPVFSLKFNRFAHRVAPLCAVLLLVATALPLRAQIRGRPPIGGQPPRGPSQGWWFSGGAAGLVMGTINDGASGKKWEFGSDPLWQLRGTLEKALDQATTLGVSVGYGTVDVKASRFEPLSPLVDCLPGPPCAQDSWNAQIDTWQLMGQFRSGGGAGFHTFFEAQGGVNGFKNLRTRDSTKTVLGAEKMIVDLAGSLGFGFGYSLSPGMVIALVQDFGMGWHSKDALPDGASRTFRTRATRASLRFKF